MRPGRPGPRLLAAALTTTAVALVGGCARQGAPPGGAEDRRPPVVVRTEPDTFAQVEGFRGPVRFVFDERISERLDGTLEDAVLVSPRTGAARVKRGRRSIEVELEGGFQDGRVYRVTLLPVVRDLFNNQLRDPFELVFSTGGEVLPNAVAGLVWDRISGRSIEGAWVQARAQGEDSTVVYVARSDTGGIYALRFLPEARYDLQAFVDRNRNGELDPTEQRGVANFPVRATDTMLANVSVLAPDTSPAVVTRVDVVDSVTLVVSMDDYLAPTMPLTTVGVGLTAVVDTTAPEPADTVAVVVPTVARVFHEHEYAEWLEAVADSFARLDSLEAEARARAARAAAVASEDPTLPRPRSDTTAARDTVRLRGEDEPEQGVPPRARRLPPSLPAPASRGAAQGATGPDGGPLPSRRVVALLDGFLPPNRAFTVSVTGVRNINGLPLGGGEAVVVRQPPPAPADTAAVGDTLSPADTAAPPDTGGVARTGGPRR